MKILITAGATWIKIDAIRILTNRFTGKTGLYLAGELKKKGHRVTLLINPHCTGKIKGLEAIYYHYFEEFKEKVAKILKNEHYDVIIHMAAVSDYKLKNTPQGKIPSGSKSLLLRFVPTEKIIKRIRMLAKKSLIVQFKLEPKRKGIVEDAYRSLKENKSDFVVANALEDLTLGYKGFLINRDKEIIPIKSKKELLDILDRAIRGKLKLRCI